MYSKGARRMVRRLDWNRGKYTGDGRITAQRRC
jgi:hypothetical protein